MIGTNERQALLVSKTIDVSCFKEEPLLGNSIPLAIQLKGLNRLNRIGRRNIEERKGVTGSLSTRPVAKGIFMVIRDLRDHNFLTTEDSEYNRTFSDPRGVAIQGNDVYIGSVDRINYLNALTGNISTIRHPWFAFIHSLELNNNGAQLLVTSPGFDRIIEIDTNTGKPTWEWSAWAHGYSHTVGSHKTIVSGSKNAMGVNNVLIINDPSDYPGGLGLPPGDRTAFPNSAITLDKNHILATLFHDGLIKINKKTGESTTILNGLSHPHGIRRYKSGFVVTDTGNGVCIVLDKNLHPIQYLSFVNLPDKAPEAGAAEWLQQVVPINDQLLCAIDSNRGSIFIVDPETHLIRRVPYNINWVMQEVCPLSLETANRLSGLQDQENISSNHVLETA